MQIGTVIDCDRCLRQHTPTCDDCIVTFLHRGAPVGTAVVVDVAERRRRRPDPAALDAS